MGCFVSNRSCHCSFSLPIDHSHEQKKKKKKKIKGVWGSHWSHGKSSMLERWMVAGPELCRVVDEFEGVQNELGELPHHQEGRTSRRRFLSHVRDLMNVILMNGNLFEEQLRGLVSLGDKVCESPTSEHSFTSLNLLGRSNSRTIRKVFYTQGK